MGAQLAVGESRQIERQNRIARNEGREDEFRSRGLDECPAVFDSGGRDRPQCDAGIVGRVFETGQLLSVPDAYAEPLFNRAVDEETGFRTRNILAVPLRDSHERVFGVAELLNKADGEVFDPDDERRFLELTKSMQVLLESWWRMAAEGTAREEPADS